MSFSRVDTLMSGPETIRVPRQGPEKRKETNEWYCFWNYWGNICREKML